MKNYIKNNPFLSFVIIAMWIFYIVVSLSEKGFFTKHITEPIGTTISFIGIGAVITINKRKKKIRIDNEKNDENADRNEKIVNSNKVKIIFKRYIYIIVGLATIITITVFLYYKAKFSVSLFFLTIFLCCFGEICIVGPIALIAQIVMEYRRDCKEQGILKPTIGLIVFLIISALIIHNKYPNLFK